VRHDPEELADADNGNGPRLVPAASFRRAYSAGLCRAESSRSAYTRTLVSTAIIAALP
jgi:hypothetical protein